MNYILEYTKYKDCDIYEVNRRLKLQNGWSESIQNKRVITKYKPEFKEELREIFNNKPLSYKCKICKKDHDIFNKEIEEIYGVSHLYSGPPGWSLDDSFDFNMPSLLFIYGEGNNYERHIPDLDSYIKVWKPDSKKADEIFFQENVKKYNL